MGWLSFRRTKKESFKWPTGPRDPWAWRTLTTQQTTLTSSDTLLAARSNESWPPKPSRISRYGSSILTQKCSTPNTLCDEKILVRMRRTANLFASSWISSTHSPKTSCYRSWFTRTCSFWGKKSLSVLIWTRNKFVTMTCLECLPGNAQLRWSSSHSFLTTTASVLRHSLVSKDTKKCLFFR
jgi:hypothetical protein